MLSRRTLLASGLVGGLGWLLTACGSPNQPVSRPEGAVGDGQADDTVALQRAIDRAATGGGGGRLRLPAGRYRCGTLHLRSHLTLELLAGAVIVASPRTADFDPIEQLSYNPYADQETADQRFAVLAGDGLEKLTLLGPGSVDGNRSARGGPKLVGLKRCNHVRVAGLRLVNSPNYALSLLGCSEVELAGVIVDNSYADGIDPDCCTNVTIRGCQVDSFDDGICVKSSLSLGHPAPTRHVVVRDCTVRSSSNCLKIGTETGNDVHDVLFSNCILEGRPAPGVSVVEAEGGGVAIEMVDGASLEQVTVANMTLRNVRGPLFIRLGNRGRGQVPTARPGSLSDVTISDLTATGATETSSITGVPGSPARAVRLRRVRIATRGGGQAGPGLAVDEQQAAYPSVVMFGQLPASGLYCRHVSELTLEGVELSTDTADLRPGLVADDLSDCTIAGLAGLRHSGPTPAVWLNDARSVTLIQSPALAAPGPFLRLTGTRSAAVRVPAWLEGGAGALELGSDVAPGVVSVS